MLRVRNVGRRNDGALRRLRLALGAKARNPCGARSKGESLMAKGQMRSNKEKRKPKQNKDAKKGAAAKK